MTKYITTVLILLCFITVHAQYEKGTILFKNATSKEGFIKLRSHDGLKFKENKDDQPIVYNHLQLIGFNVGNSKYRYVKRNLSDVAPRILKELIKGRITLYAQEFKAGSSSMGFGPDSNLLPITVDRKAYQLYYLFKNNRLSKVGKKLKKKHFKLFEDCPALLNQLEKDEMNRSHLFTTVDYYNENCSNSSEEQ